MGSRAGQHGDGQPNPGDRTLGVKMANPGNLTDGQMQMLAQRIAAMANTPTDAPAPGVRQYVGARYVPVFANPLEWSNAREYEPLTIVTHNGNSYTSMQSVPTGIDIANANYWALTGNFNAQVEAYRQEVAQWSGKIDDANTIANNAVTTADNAVTTANNALSVANTANTNADNAVEVASEALVNSNKKKYISFDDTLFTDWNTGINYKEFSCLYFPDTDSILLHLYIYCPNYLTSTSDNWAHICRVPEQLRPIFESVQSPTDSKTIHNVIQRWISTDASPHTFGDCRYKDGGLEFVNFINEVDNKPNRFLCDIFLTKITQEEP